MTKREELARALFAAFEKEGPEVPYVGTANDLRAVVLDGHFDLLAAVDAILDVLREPTEAMIENGARAVAPAIVDCPDREEAVEQMRSHCLQEADATFRAMIDTVKREGA